MSSEIAVRTAVVTFALLVLVGCSTLTPTNDPVYLRINDLEARLIRIERVLDNEGLIELATDISSLKTEVEAARGEIETLRFDLDNQADDQRDLYVDLNDRLSAIEQGQATIGSSSAVPAAGGVAGAVTDQGAYDAAFRLVQQMDWEGAEAAFDLFLMSYPTSPLRANAQYWLAETFYSRLEFGRAVAEFQQVLTEYPQSNKVPDALLKIGYSYYEMQNLDRARQALTRVIREFPDTSAADLADGRLRQIDEETR
jgi:tol-pal system protein YbgF